MEVHISTLACEAVSVWIHRLHGRITDYFCKDGCSSECKVELTASLRCAEGKDWHRALTLPRKYCAVNSYINPPPSILSLYCSFSYSLYSQPFHYILNANILP